MSIRIKLLTAAAAAALAFPASAQIVGDVTGEVGATVGVVTPADSADAVQDRVEAATDGVAQAADDAANAADVEAGVGAEAQADTAVVAATSADVTAGATVRDTDGALVGKIESVSASGAVVATGKSRVEIPVTSFGKNGQGLVLAMSKTELDAAAAAATPS